VARKEKEEKKPKEETAEEREAAGNPVKALKLLRNSFNKDRGDDKVAWVLTQDTDDPTTVRKWISTGSTILDYVISNRRDGGVPVGKITEIAGAEASGKSLLVAQLMANVQKIGGVCVLIDTENAYNADFARRLGVDNSKVLYLQPGTVEECFNAIEKCIVAVRGKNEDTPFLIAWDSIAGTPCQAEIEGSYDANSRIGLLAKAMSIGMKKLTGTFGKDQVTMVFTNHLKAAIGNMYGDPFFVPGGKAVPYHASTRIRLTSSTKIKDKEGEIFAIKTNAKCMKSRFGPPHRGCSFQIRFDSGVDDVNSWRDFLHEKKLIEKKNGFMFMHNVPIRVFGKDATDYVDEVMPEVKFRENDWRKLVDGDPALREHVLGLLEQKLVVRYDSSAPIVDVDGEVEEEKFESDE
jgi:recombination protein RecA